MKAIDVEASRGRMRKAMAKLVEAAKADDEVVVPQEPQEPELVPYGLAECHRRGRSEALPPRRPRGESMIVFDEEQPKPDSKAYPQCHVDARCVQRQGSGMYCGDQKCEVRMMFVSYEDSMKE